LKASRAACAAAASVRPTGQRQLHGTHDAGLHPFAEHLQEQTFLAEREDEGAALVDEGDGELVGLPAPRRDVDFVPRPRPAQFPGLGHRGQTPGRRE
jgi:hypothetical protein